MLPTLVQLLPSELNGSLSRVVKDRSEEEHHRPNEEEGKKVKKFGIATAIASGLTAAVLSIAAPAQADLGHNTWVNQIGQTATAPQVDTSVHGGR